MMSMMGFYGFGGMMNNYWGYGMMSGYRWEVNPGFGMMGWFGFSGMLGLVGIVSGALIIVGSVMLYEHPAQHSRWGVMILVLSLFSVFGTGMAGFGIGFVLSLIGGILAFTWKTPTPEK